jgi:RNA polymerase sigma-70 factor (ECF subfamily)
MDQVMGSRPDLSVAGPPPSPERFRSYLRVLAELHLGRAGREKVDPSDVVQETMLEAHKKRHQFRGHTEAEMAAWLRAMLACNLADAIKALRRGKRDVSRERSLEAAINKSSSRLEAWLVASQSSPSERLDRHEAVLELLDALTALPSAQRRALVMRHCQGCSLAQIAEELDRTPAAVAGLLKRGLATLRTILHPGP